MSVAAIVLGVADALAFGARRRRDRLARFVSAAGVGPLAAGAPGSAPLVRSLASVGRLPARWLGLRADSEIERLLDAAGRPSGIGATEFVQARMGASLLGAALLGMVAMIVAPSFVGVAVGLTLGLAVGAAVPAMVVRRIVSARRSALMRALPSALDLMSLCADSGLGLEGALREAARRWDNALTAELRRVAFELELGRDRAAVLREFARRTNLVATRRFASIVMQADTLGIPLARSLSELASEIRTAQRQRAEEAARKAPIKMLFPMVLLVFPSLFIVILGPAIPRFMEVFNVGP
jgi:tight adherence protein C